MSVTACHLGGPMTGFHLAFRSGRLLAAKHPQTNDLPDSTRDKEHVIA